MFCRNCGSEIEESAVFCANCGKPVGEIQQVQPQKSVPMILKLIKNYFTKPLSFFSELKDEKTLSTSIGLIIGLPVIYGLLNILYNSTIINGLFKMINKIPDLMEKGGVISAKQAITARQEIVSSDEIVEFKNKIYAAIDNSDIFFNSAAKLIVLIIITSIVLAILNAIMVKNKMSVKDILFISSTSYIPLVIALPLAIIATFVSVVFGMFILITGYILSFITLYSGIKQLSEEKNNKVFIIMTILLVILSVIVSIYVVEQFQNYLISTIKFTKSSSGLF